MPPDEAGPAPLAGPPWPVRSGTVPALADGFSSRLETAPDLAAALPPGAAVALVPDRAAAPAVGPGPAAIRAAQDWLRSSGKTQLAAAFAESLWQSGGVDLLVWIEATSRASVLSGYAAAMAAATGRDQASSCESVAAQFLSWLGETSRSWLVVLDDLADPADLDGLWPAGPAGRVLVTSADAAAVPGGMRVVPVGPFRLARGHQLSERRLSADPDQRHRRDRAGQRPGLRAGRAGPGQRGDRQLPACRAASTGAISSAGGSSWPSRPASAAGQPR